MSTYTFADRTPPYQDLAAPKRLREGSKLVVRGLEIPSYEDSPTIHAKKRTHTHVVYVILAYPTYLLVSACPSRKPGDIKFRHVVITGNALSHPKSTVGIG